MNDDEYETEPSESDYSSGSDHDMPAESGSSPEPVQHSRVPALSLGGAPPSDPSRHRRPAVPLLGLAMASTEGVVSAATQPACTDQQVSDEAEQTLAGDGSSVAETAPLQLAEVVDRNEKAQSVSRANSHRRPSRHMAAPLFTVQIASEAFAISPQALAEPEYMHLSESEAVKAFCSSRLGLRVEALKFYELREVQSLAVCSESCTQLALAVEDSSTHLLCYHCSMLAEMVGLTKASAPCRVFTGSL